MTDETDHPSVARVRQALRDAGAATASIDGLLLLPDAVTTATAAADALGVQTGQIANSLVFDADGEPLLVLTSGAHRVDTDKVAALLGIGSLGRASKELVREATGQVIGGVAPVGHPAPLRTLVDTALAQFDVVWAAGGVARAVFPTTFDELVRVTGGTPADVV
ncbi:YbaK/EbsC family protein [Pseudonocardia endophytica]|uniref:Prolyl-tRNA editing enzyme YbaK/EbsC (Cys-tRNA(Pro) deacylase) n=1 Tax=Pseudonocardia endophytica TaxID=401976 RepID=A0A4R1HHY7_PSEEN|nr:YbaK/EbsC family protein [Pseudonocardia endophytica]TCK20443.1 prolyl-tRNA editing enzyme YbaK/EbsC (Cys-tRNA(Pro) deacylase) [Pseudonocardia endophytica]